MKDWKNLLFITFIITNTCFATPKIIDRIIAIVNNDVILESDIQNFFQYLTFNVKQVPKFYTEYNTSLYDQILDRLILDQIILQISKKIGLKISDEQLNQVISNIAKQNNITIEQMYNYLMLNGIDYSNYRNQICKEILISEIRNNEVNNRININYQEIERLVNNIFEQKNDDTEINFNHIFIPLSKNPSYKEIIKAKMQAKSIIKQAYNGKDFGKVIIYSMNQKIIKYKQTDYFDIKKLLPNFVQILETAKNGDIIGPISSNAGFHVIKINDVHNYNHNIYITEVHIRHILLKTSPDINDNQIREKLEKIALDIKNGKISFNEAAKEFSQDQDSASNGGDLGWVSLDVYDSSFRDEIIKLNQRQISAPIHSPYGWHIIELLNKRSLDKTDTLKKNQAYYIIYDRKFHEEAPIWMQEQRAKAYVKIIKN